MRKGKELSAHLTFIAHLNDDDDADGDEGGHPLSTGGSSYYMYYLPAPLPFSFPTIEYTESVEDDYIAVARGTFCLLRPPTMSTSHRPDEGLRLSLALLTTTCRCVYLSSDIYRTNLVPEFDGD